MTTRKDPEQLLTERFNMWAEVFESTVPDNARTPEGLANYVKTINFGMRESGVNPGDFPKAIKTAWRKARRFPVVSDFHEGFSGESKYDDHSAILREYGYDA